jgi:flagellar biosynthesis protein FlhG
MDQAQSLRRAAAGRRPAPAAGALRTIAVTSGKGGVGKTSVVVNLALELAKRGRKVLLIDADLGLANVDVMLGLAPQHSINDVIHGAKTLDEVIVEGPRGIKILPAASGVSELSHLSRDEKLMILQELDAYQTDADTVLIDTAAGISDMVLYFNTAAQERVVVATSEPTSLTDAYALIKVLHTQHQERRFRILVNNVAGSKEAKEVYRKLSMAADHFLGGLSLNYLGFIPADPSVNRAVMRQKALVEDQPGSPAARAMAELAQTILNLPAEEASGNIKFFWRRLVNMA